MSFLSELLGLSSSNLKSVKPLISVVYGFPLDRTWSEEGRWEDLFMSPGHFSEEDLALLHHEGLIHLSNGQKRGGTSHLWGGGAVTYMVPFASPSGWAGPVISLGPLPEGDAELDWIRQVWFTKAQALCSPGGRFDEYERLWDVLRRGYAMAPWGMHILVYVGKIEGPPALSWNSQKFSDEFDEDSWDGPQSIKVRRALAGIED